MGDGAEYPGWIPCGAELDKTRTKFRILKFFPDEIRLRLYYAGQGRKSPCLKIYPLQNQWRQGDMAEALS